MGFLAWIKKEGTELKDLFVSHEAGLETVATDLQQTATATAAIAQAAGATKYVPILSGIADGAGKISVAIQAGSTVTDIQGGVADLTTLASGLVDSGDIGVKDAATQNGIGLVLTKVNNVAAVANAAVSAAPAA